MSNSRGHAGQCGRLGQTSWTTVGASPETLVGGREEYDAVFVGSGINSLVGAALLAKKGWRVGVLERSHRLGGAIWTARTRAGFTVELLSIVWLPFTLSPGYAILRDDLERHGVRFATSERPWGVLRDDGRALVMTSDHAANVARMDRLCPGDGEAWDRAVKKFVEDADDVFGAFGVYPWSLGGLRWAFGVYRRRRGAGSRALLADSLVTARAWLEETFQDPLIHGLIAPWSLHGNKGPDQAATGMVARVNWALTEANGVQMPVGGGGEVVRALKDIIEEHGGECLIGVDVDRVLVRNRKAIGVGAGARTYRATRAVVCCVTPRQLYGRLLEHAAVPRDLRTSAARWRAGTALFQLNFSLARRLAWRADDDLASVAVININNGMDAVSRAANEAIRGLLPGEPNLCLVQTMAVDASRGPADGWQLYIQVGEIPAVVRGDAAGEIDAREGWTDEVRELFADRLQRQLERHLPGLSENIIERVAMSPRDLEAANINLVGGSAQYGTAELDQMLPGLPLLHAPSPRTPVKGLYHIGASTHPGISLGGLSGHLFYKAVEGAPLARVRRVARRG
jgi:phytoene dehydrogenase-like protein